MAGVLFLGPTLTGLTGLMPWKRYDRHRFAGKPTTAQPA
jgi:hypothetical protein